MFFDLLLFCASSSNSISLEQASTKIFEMYGLSISKQSLDERYNDGAVKFVKEVLKEVLEKELSHVFCDCFLPQFNYVRIKDSTRFNVANRLSDQFKGSGGNGTRTACVCIQYEYDVKSGKILDIEITPGTINDSTNAKETHANINNKDLVIRDLGYYNLGILESFNEIGAYYISRLNLTTAILDTKTGKDISFKNLYNDMMAMKIDSMEIVVLVSKGRKVKLRLIVNIVPEQVYQKRIRDVNKNNKENGYNTSDDYKSRARFNMFITNIPNELLSKDEILLMYKLRWQIELMFKNWKSICAIDKIQPMRYQRFACILFAKLILIVLKLQLLWYFQRYFYQTKRKMLSPYKCFKTLQGAYFSILRCIIKNNRKKSEDCIEKIRKLFSKNHWKENKKNKVGYTEIFDILFCISNIYNYICATKKEVSIVPPSQNSLTKKFIDMVKLEKSNPISKRNGVKKELYPYHVE